MPKLCECGCGQAAPISTRTDLRRGWRKGQPIKFISGHYGRKQAQSKLAQLRLAGAINRNRRRHDASAMDRLLTNYFDRGGTQ